MFIMFYNINAHVRWKKPCGADSSNLGLASGQASCQASTTIVVSFLLILVNSNTDFYYSSPESIKWILN